MPITINSANKLAVPIKNILTKSPVVTGVNHQYNKMYGVQMMMATSTSNIKKIGIIYFKEG